MTKKMREWLKKHYQDKYEPHDAYEVENKYPKTKMDKHKPYAMDIKLGDKDGQT